MRKETTVELSVADRFRLDVLVAGWNSPQEPVSRLWIVLLTTEGDDAGEIIRRAGTSKATRKAANYGTFLRGDVRKPSSAGNVR